MLKKRNSKNVNTKKQLPFDFYLPESNLLIEYDGSQHFHDVFGSNKEYIQQHKRDLIKNKLCIENGVNLMRIKYNVSIPKIKNLLTKLINEGLTVEDYKKYKLYVVDCDEDINSTLEIITKNFIISKSVVQIKPIKLRESSYNNSPKLE